MGYVPSRADDDRLLRMLALRRGGATVRTIGTRFGLSGARVSQLADAVRAADLLESGDPSGAVESAYWRVRGKGVRDAG